MRIQEQEAFNKPRLTRVETINFLIKFITYFYNFLSKKVLEWEWSMGVLDNPDLINDSSILLSTDLLDSHVGGVGKVKPGVSVVRRPEGGPVWVILVEVVMFLSAARRAWAVRGSADITIVNCDKVGIIATIMCNVWLYG